MEKPIDEEKAQADLIRRGFDWISVQIIMNGIVKYNRVMRGNDNIKFVALSKWIVTQLTTGGATIKRPKIEEGPDDLSSLLKELRHSKGQ